MGVPLQLLNSPQKRERKERREEKREGWKEKNNA
jgi:hypothetical protein